jgi:hypothetical protein
MPNENIEFKLKKNTMLQLLAEVEDSPEVAAEVVFIVAGFFAAKLGKDADKKWIDWCKKVWEDRVAVKDEDWLQWDEQMRQYYDQQRLSELQSSRHDRLVGGKF